MAKEKKITYSGVKGTYILQRMKEGKTNDQARKMWKRSEEAKQFKFSGYPERNGLPGINDGVFIDRSYDSPWQDYAHTADDL